ncbi:hypothetical protein GCM10009693_11130 [Leucobacter chromiireducens subsp. chromiireducens]
MWISGLDVDKYLATGPNVNPATPISDNFLSLRVHALGRVACAEHMPEKTRAGWQSRRTTTPLEKRA